MREGRGWRKGRQVLVRERLQWWPPRLRWPLAGASGWEGWESSHAWRFFVPPKCWKPGCGDRSMGERNWEEMYYVDKGLVNQLTGVRIL